MRESTIPKQEQTQGQTAPTREASRTLTPPCDIYETPVGLTVLVDLPGVEKDAVEVRVEDDVLSIKGAAKSTLPMEPVYSEYALTGFFRQFQLTEHVAQEKIQAEMKHGVLTIHLPRAEKAKPKKVTVNVTS
jgi:HSP20 family molecular chaperone IbpA